MMKAGESSTTLINIVSTLTMHREILLVPTLFFTQGSQISLLPALKDQEAYYVYRIRAAP